MNSALLRTLLVYGIIVPLAVLLGWMVSNPYDPQSMGFIGAVVFVLLIPVLLKYHSAMLVFSWNALMIVFFLPGQPSLWALMTGANLAMAVGYRILQRRPLFTHVPMLTFSWLALAAVILITAKIRGGIGVRALGSGSYGGKQYFYVLMAIAGYFAWAGIKIDLTKLPRFLKMFYLSGISSLIPNIIYTLNIPALFVLYYLFPAAAAVGQAYAEYFGLQMARIGGLATAGTAVMHFLLARHGLRGVFNLRYPWRLILFMVLGAVAALSGFRAILLALIVVISILALFEGLLFTRWALVAVLFGGVTLATLSPMATKLPLSIQRTLSFLPIDVDPVARADAQASLEWRILMWRAVLPELPDYLWLGKGYTINPTDLYLTSYAQYTGAAREYEGAIVAGDYHSGPLSVYVPFGLPGVLAFVAVIGLSLRGLWLNYKFGPDQLRIVNRFLLALFITKAVFFVVVFGSLHSDLAAFAGIIGASVALNRGVCRQTARQSTRRVPVSSFNTQPTVA